MWIESIAKELEEAVCEYSPTVNPATRNLGDGWFSVCWLVQEFGYGGAGIWLM